MELSVQLLIEMIGHGRQFFFPQRQLLMNYEGSNPNSDEPGFGEEDLLAVLRVCHFNSNFNFV
jgi:hypothetical protein